MILSFTIGRLLLRTETLRQKLCILLGAFRAVPIPVEFNPLPGCTTKWPFRLLENFEYHPCHKSPPEYRSKIVPRLPPPATGQYSTWT